MSQAAVLAMAMAVDLLAGEPPNAVHPVVYIGKAISLAERISPSRGRAAQVLAGAAIAIVVPSVFALAAHVLLTSLAVCGARMASNRATLIEYASFILEVVLLKATFSLRGLRDAARVVRDAIERGALPEARYALRSLCSRDASRLDPPGIIAATIESVAENASDSFVAPVLFFAVFGVPGALFYRAVNTLDAMIGYRGKYEYLGKASARLDDLLNLVPARVTSLLLLASGALLRLDTRHALRILWRDGSATESPNAGGPMATMAGLLRIELAKLGHYRLGDAVDPLAPRKIDEAWNVVHAGAWILAATVMLVLGGAHGLLQ